MYLLFLYFIVFCSYGMNEKNLVVRELPKSLLIGGISYGFFKNASKLNFIKIMTLKTFSKNIPFSKFFSIGFSLLDFKNRIKFNNQFLRKYLRSKENEKSLVLEKSKKAITSRIFFFDVFQAQKDIEKNEKDELLKYNIERILQHEKKKEILLKRLTQKINKNLFKFKKWEDDAISSHLFVSSKGNYSGEIIEENPSIMITNVEYISGLGLIVTSDKFLFDRHWKIEISTTVEDQDIDFVEFFDMNLDQKIISTKNKKHIKNLPYLKELEKKIIEQVWEIFQNNIETEEKE